MSDDESGEKRGDVKTGSGSPFSRTRHPTIPNGLDTVLDLLSESRRRNLLYYLFTIEGDVAEFESAVNGVYRYETAATDADDRVSRESIRIGLHHNHLPRLANAGVIDYDRRHGTIRLTENPAFEALVERVHDGELD